jgi:hypothetical protein
MNLSEKRFCGFAWTGDSVRFPIRHLEVRILPPQPAIPALDRVPKGRENWPEIPAFRAFAFVARLPVSRS